MTGLTEMARVVRPGGTVAACVWDHAGGHILFTEAGGLIKDFNGGDIDFAQGRHIKGERNYGMIAALPSVFEKVERAVKEVLARRPS